jgi:hypothetical protein
MGFFKPSSTPVSSKSVARLQALIWVLIYAGLLVLVLGLSVARVDAALGWLMVAIGGGISAAGFLLIYVRSRIRSHP